jgi:hypothetical protein
VFAFLDQMLIHDILLAFYPLLKDHYLKILSNLQEVIEHLIENIQKIDETETQLHSLADWEFPI